MTEGQGGRTPLVGRELGPSRHGRRGDQPKGGKTTRLR